MTKKTRQVADELGVSYWTLLGLFRSGKMKPPSKDVSGDFTWTPAEVTKARRLLEKNQTNAGAGVPA